MPPKPNRENIPVLAAVIRRGDQYLVAKRPLHKRHGGLWEFPGGKLHRGESWTQAARRELQEELGVEVRAVGDPMFRRTDPGSRFDILFVDSVGGGPWVAGGAHAENRTITADHRPPRWDFHRYGAKPNTTPSHASGSCAILHRRGGRSHGARRRRT